MTWLSLTEDVTINLDSYDRLTIIGGKGQCCLVLYRDELPTIIARCDDYRNARATKIALLSEMDEHNVVSRARLEKKIVLLLEKKGF